MSSNKPKEANQELIKIIKKYMEINKITDGEEARFLDTLNQKISNKMRGSTLNNDDLYVKLKASLDTKSLAERNIMLQYIENKILQGYIK